MIAILTILSKIYLAICLMSWGNVFAILSWYGFMQDDHHMPLVELYWNQSVNILLMMPKFIRKPKDKTESHLIKIEHWQRSWQL